MSGNPQGSEFQVNITTNRSQRTNPGSTSPYPPRAIASDRAGNFVVAWTSQAQDGDGGGIYIRLFDSAGNPLAAAPGEIRVNSTATNEQRLASVAMDDDGDFVVVWRSFQDDNSAPLGPESYGIYAQRFSRTGVPQGGEIQVASTTINEGQPSVAMDASGDFVITWTGGSDNDIYTARFDGTNGSQVGANTVINTTTDGSQQLPNVAMDQNGNYVVVWASTGQDGDGDGIYAQRFDASGVPLGGEFRINVETISNQRNPSVSMDQSGNFVVAWASENQDTNLTGIYYRRFDSSGTALDATDQRANDTYIGDQNYPTVSYERDGDSFVISWSSSVQTGDGDGTAVVVRRFNEFGTAQSDEILANTYTFSNQEYPSVAIDADSDFVAIWSSPQDLNPTSPTTPTYGIYGQRFGRALATAPTDIDLTPVALSQGLPSVNENVASGALIGTLTASDSDTPAANLTFTLVNEAGFNSEAFTIVNNELILTETPNFELRPSYRVKVQVTDGTGTYDEVFEIRVVNSPFEIGPTDITLTSTSVDENVPNNTVVGILAADDPEPGDSFTYSLVAGIGSEDNGSFQIVGNELQIRTSPDFETKSSYSIRLQARDQGGNVYEEFVVINVNNLFELPPTEISLDAESVRENVAAGTLVANVSGTDPETALGDVLTFTLVPDFGDNAAFTLSNGQLKINSSPDFENQQSYSIRVLATDRGGKTLTRDFTINVQDVPFDIAPTEISLDSTSVVENVPADTLVATVTGSDPEIANGGDSLTFTLVNGAFDNAAFTLVNGQLKIVASPDYETKSSYRILLRATDRGNNTFDQEFTINVTDIPYESPPTNLELDATSVNENVSANAEVATITGTDLDVGDSLTYSLVPNFGDNALFNILNDKLRISDSPNFEVKSSYSIRLRVTDAGNNTYEEDFTISVNNLFEQAPTAITLDRQTVGENVAVDTLVATVTGTDPETATGDTLTFSLLPDFGDNASFTLVNGQLKIQVSPNFENKASYSVGIRATDAGGNVFDQNFVINVTDTPFELAPTDIQLDNTSVVENVAAGSSVAIVTGTDADVGSVGDVLTFTLAPNFGDNAAFTLVNGELKIVNSPDYEAKSSYSIRIVATDQGNNTYTEDFTINVTDVQFELAPTGLSLDKNRVDENVAVNTPVATITGTDPETGDTLTYSLANNTGDNAFFSVSGNQLVITARPDFEAKPSYTIRLRATDAGNNSYEQDFTISVNNLFEQAPTAINLDRQTVGENVAVDTLVATVTGTDPETATGDTLTFSLLPDFGDNASFTLVNGQLKIQVSPNLEDKASYSVGIRATDAGGNVFDQNFVINVTDVLFDVAPTDIQLDNTSVVENVAAGSPVAIVTGTDADVGSGGDILTFTLAPDFGDNAAFTLVNGELKIVNSPNYEVKSSYSIRIVATDQGNNTYTEDFTINVTDVQFELAPTEISLDNTRVDENVAANTPVATITGTDPETGDTLTYSLANNTGDNAFFSVSGNQLVITARPDFEAKPSYTIRLRATDAGNNSYEQNFTISVNNLFEQAPTAITLDRQTVGENVAVDTLVATVTGTDPETATGDTLTFSLLPNFGDNASFTLVNGQLKIQVSPNFEDKASYSVGIRATDAGGNVFDQNFVINVTDTPFELAPTDIQLDNTSVVENVAAGSSVAIVTGTDADVGSGGDVLTFTLAPDFGDNAAFTLVNGELKIVNSPDYEAKSSYSIRIVATDQGNNTYTEDFTINVTDVQFELAPTEISLDNTRVDENVVANTPVAIISGVDPETGDTLTYSLANNTGDNAFFSVSGNQLVITARPDFEAKPSYTIRLRATDAGNNSYEQDFTISVNNLFEQAPTAITLDRQTVGENVAVDTLVATVTGTDPETATGDTLTFSLLPDFGDNASFTLVNGQLKIQVSPNLEDKASYSVGIRATDAGGNVFDQNFVINVTDVLFDVAPTDIQLDNTSVVENVAAGSPVAIVTGTDADVGSGGDVLTFTLAPNFGDNAAFTLVNGELKIVNSPNYEAKSSYSIRIVATDQGNNTYTEDFTINVTDVQFELAPTGLSLDKNRVDENVAVNTPVATITGTDPETGDTLTYSLANNTGDNAFFSVSGNQLVITARPDFEAKPSYTIRLRATDAGNNSYEQDFTISVNNLFEQPPTAINLDRQTVGENVAVDTLVATVTGTDPETALGDTLTFSLLPDFGDNASFTLVNGQLKIQVSPNFENKASYSVGIRATDAGGNVFDQNFVINVTDALFDVAPTDIQLNKTNVAENVAAGSSVAIVTGTDADVGSGGDVLTFTLAPNFGDNAAFTLVNGELKIVNSPNYEAKSSYSIRIIATDRGNNTYTEDFTINVTDVQFELAPTGLSLDKNRVDENVAANTPVATITGTDPETGDTLTYSLANNTGDNAFFSVSGNQLVITARPDFEAKPSYTIRLRATDAGNNSYEQDFTISVNDLFEQAPNDLNLDNTSIDENVPINTVVATITGLDPELAAGDTLTFSLPSGGNNDNARFVVVGNQLQILVSPDYENKASYVINLRATDRGGKTYDETFTITVNDLPFERRPTDITLSPMTVNENVAANTAIATLGAIDPDVGDSFTFSLVPNSFDNAAFTIAGNQLQINASPDFETKSSYRLLLRVTDRGNNTFDKEFTIQVNNQSDLRPTDLTLVGTSITENQSAGTLVGNVAGIDPEPGDILTYSLVPNFGDNTAFTLTNGDLRIAASPNFEVKPSYSIRVRATDRGGNTYDEDFTITVNNLFDVSPTDISLGSTTIAENATANAVVGAISGADPEPGDSLTFSLVPAFGDNGAFSIVNGQLVINNSPDFEVKPSYSIRLRATDAGSNIFEKDFTISVTNSPFDRLPTDILLSSTTVAENAGANAVIGTITGVDPDTGDTLTFSLVSGDGSADNGAFSIVNNRLVLNASPDFETRPSYSVRLRATDQGNNVYEEAFTINVTNTVYELAPTSITLSSTAVPENAAPSAVVATVSGVDPETSTGDRLTFSLLPNVGDNAAFTLNGTELRINASPNFEAKPSYNITLRATDQGGNVFDQTFTINVTDIGYELAPTDILLSSTTVNENVIASTVVATLSGADADPNDSLTFALVAGAGDTGNGAFTVVGNQLRITASPDFETQSSYSIRLRATDLGNNTYDEVVTITVNNLPEGLAPNDIVLSSDRINENVNPGTPVGTLSATDPDGNAGLTFSLVNAPGYDTNAFTIVGNELQMAVRPDYETKSLYRIKIRVQDPNGQTYDEDFIISVNDLPENRTPTDISLTSTAIAENSSAGSVVGTLVTSDPDTGDTFTYTLVNEPGLDTASFAIVNNTLQITTIPDYETKSSYTIRIRTTDSSNLSREEVFTITVLDRQETSAPTSLTLSSTSLAENSSAGSVVGTLVAVDPDAGESITYTLVDGQGATDNSAFQIVGNQLRIVASPDFETKPNYTVRVRATDLQGNTIENTFAIAILDLQDNVGNANAPTLDLNGAEAGVNYVAPFTPGVPIRVMSDAAILTDSDSTNLVSALVAISNPLNTPNEVLTVDVSGTNIRATYETTGALTLTGNASLADYLKVLKTVTYNNTISVPGDEPRTLVFVLDDGVNTNEAAITQLIPSLTNTVQGTAGNDPSLNTTARTDLLTALTGDDVVTSSLQNLQQDDRLDGGEGVDTLHISSGTGSVVVNVGLTTSQVTGMDPETQIFNFEAFDLSGFQGTSQMIGSSVGADLFVGGEGNDSLSGLGGNDRLTAGAGNDLLDGGVGIDTLDGGAGNDIYVVDSLQDAVIEGVNGGADQIRSSINYALGANQENLVLFGAARRGTGNTGANRITGTGAANRLDGGAGNDVLDGGRGIDTLLGGAGNDQLIGGVGRDVLNGGLGSDRFVLSAARDSRGDTLQDFNSARDVMQISLQTLRTLIPPSVPNTLRIGTIARTQLVLGKGARNSSQRFVYDRSTGNLFFDADGNGATTQTFIARLQGGVAMNYTDISITR